MMKYPKEYLEEIKLRLKVSQVVGKFVQLKKRGKEFIGLSPFKNEKTPSFTVNDQKEFYHCFSTGEHGNIFDFYMKTKSMSFGEAVRTLASEAGMQPYRFSKIDEKKEKKYNTYKEIISSYKEYSHKELFKNNDSVKYLNNRGINEEVIKNFELGYIPWKSNFFNELLKNFKEEEIISTGLFYKNDRTGDYVDRFNSRILFPINNLNGHTIAFGGRTINKNKLAKYINSPETEFYKKGKVVFNLDKTKMLRSETNQIIVVEGYMDVLSLYSKGVKNVISNSGIALTENQIDLIWRFFSHPILCLDGDVSGQSATMRIAEKLFPLITEKNKIFFSLLPEGKDPDDFIKSYGKEKFIKLLENKLVIQEYIWLTYSKNINFRDPFEVSKFEKQIKKLCYSIKDEVLKKYITEDFLNKIKNLTPLQNNYSKNFNNRFNKDNFRILNETKKIHQHNKEFTKENIKEFSILYIMLNHIDSTQKYIKEISEITFSLEKGEQLKKTILKNLSKEYDYTKLQKEINTHFKDFIDEINEAANIKLILNSKTNDNISEILFELISELKDLNNLKKIESLELKLMNNLDENSYSELVKLKSELNRD